MVELKKGDYIDVGNERYILLEDATNKGKEVLRNAKVERESDGIQYFLKYTNEQDEVLSKYLEREGSFKMYNPYIVHIEKFFEDGEDNYRNKVVGVISEYVDGVNMAEFREESERFNADRCFFYMMQLLHGVRAYTEYVLTDPFVHRDLKPENIMISEKDDKVVIIDFDWAHVHKSNKTGDGVFGNKISGTRGFGDPRAWYEGYHNSTDIQMDIYALGRVFCYWINGKEYFKREKKEHNIYTENTEEGRKLAYSCYPRRLYDSGFFVKGTDYSRFEKLTNMIAKMVAPPEDRYSKVSDIIKDFEGFLIEYYGSCEEYKKKIYEPQLLLVSKSEKDSKKIGGGYCFSDSRTSVTIHWEDYRIYDIFSQGEIIMSVYSVGEKVYYIPVNPAWSKDSEEDGNYEVCNGDTFTCKDTVSFNQNKLRFILTNK